MSRPLYYWRLFTYYLTIPLSVLGLSGWRVSVGIWFRFTQDRNIGRVEAPSHSTSDVEIYRYKHLDKNAIRLLELEPGEYDDPLKGHLVHTDMIEAKQQYIALSYVWGFSRTAHRIQIDDAFLQIMDSLDSALRALRSEDRTVTVWADAICINQSDIYERSSQVPLMTEIYRDATEVFCWLGDATDASVVGMEILSYLIDDRPFDGGAPWRLHSLPEIANSLGDILDRAYFKRIWVVQEAALGRRVTLQVGGLSVTWEASNTRRFLARIKLLEWTSTSASGSPQAESMQIDFGALRELLEQSSSVEARRAGHVLEPTILDTAHTMRHRYSTDPRDRIFGMIGFVDSADVAGMVPDYEQTWDETYRKFYEHAYAVAMKGLSKELN